ncbi:GntR family transcriptional regulator [Tissierella sp. MSJ-40]|uniref:GntR family transcriptional regulator n=1 Tax=Tissierella simiarum TaxID=2841534 RepID=A0ABS6E4G1_9FIRM|nr:GntR family transcriptional regulator [Tissierella simiarum]MBU5437797.1 GntR family transcriptional regulator [Tissierella simiarum]
MFNIDISSSTPIYQQIIDSVKEGILKGLMEPGEKLPSVRELAKMMTLNPNTIQKAYQELEREKVIVTLRGKGTYISADYKPRKDESKIMEVKDLFKKGIVEAHYMGFKKEDIYGIIEELIKELEGVESNDKGN